MSRTVDATPYLEPCPSELVRRPVTLRLTDDTYALEPTPGEAWLPIAFRAFSRIAGRIRVRDALIVGTGNGLDALGAVEIFRPDSLAVTDLFAASVAVSRENILAHLVDPGSTEITFHVGDLVADVSPERRFDLVYENLPNIPATPEIELERGVNTGRFFDGSAVRAVPEPFGSYLLALHYRCLQDVRPLVRHGGGVLTAIGGRMPLEVAFDLHRACGYTPELMAFDVKLQVESDLVMRPYALAARTSGLELTFYAAEAIGVVAEARRDGLDGQALADAVADDLLRLAIGAAEAARRSARGEAIAHSVLMVFGALEGVPETGRPRHSP
jgi:hypothetical protein